MSYSNSTYTINGRTYRNLEAQVLENMRNAGNAAKAITQLTTRVDNCEDAVNDLAENKQDKLIAGDNITIVDNVISATGGGEGSDVEVTPIITEGTNIADITVDGVVSHLYAPTAESTVSDVKVAGTSVVTDSIANIPTATTSVSGVVKADNLIGTRMETGAIGVVNATDANIEARKAYRASGYGVISTDNYDIAVKNALVNPDEEFTEEEKEAIKSNLDLDEGNIKIFTGMTGSGTLQLDTGFTIKDICDWMGASGDLPYKNTHIAYIKARGIVDPSRDYHIAVVDIATQTTSDTYTVRAHWIDYAGAPTLWQAKAEAVGATASNLSVVSYALA